MKTAWLGYNGKHLKVDPNDADWAGLQAALHPQLDAHSHYQLLQNQLIAHLRPQQARKIRRPKKATIFETTRSLACEKRNWRQQLIKQTRLQRRTLLEAFFTAWKHGRGDLDGQFDDLLILQDQLIASALHQFRRLGRLATQGMRKHDKAFFQSFKVFYKMVMNFWSQRT